MKFFSISANQPVSNSAKAMNRQDSKNAKFFEKGGKV
jgi:hypothetical protein